MCEKAVYFFYKSVENISQLKKTSYIYFIIIRSNFLSNMRKILIVDDEVNIGVLLSKFLTRNSFSVSTATSGVAAMEYLAKEAYDLVLCDYRLDDTDGREMLIKIKESYPSTGVIIITGYSDIKLAVELIKLGAYDYITKPLYPDEILNTINKN